MYGQIIIGAPGAGKSTYCDGMSQLLSALKRPTICINLDPANELIPYKCDIDIRELITVDEVMNRLKLGPNGALRYCMHTLGKNLEWLRRKLSSFDNAYFLIDFPGQLELYNSDDCIANIIHSMEKWGHRLVTIHLSDSMYCSDAGKFISVVMSALSVMLNLETPQLNVLSKMDLFNNEISYSEDFFKELPSLTRLLQLLDDNAVLKRYKAMNESICTLIEDFDLINFIGIDVTQKENMMQLLKAADLANGFTFTEQTDLRNITIK